MPLPINIRSAIASDAHKLLAIRWDAIISLVDNFGHVAERWANSASPDRATLAIQHNTVWVAESESMVVGWIEVKGAKVNGLYVGLAENLIPILYEVALNKADVI